MWGPGGWIGDLGALDFAGGTVVHISAGVAALVAAIVLGPRRQGGAAPDERPHNVPMVMLGAALLWFGWIGFNGGSALAANGTAVLAVVNTILGGAGAMTAWVLLEQLRDVGVEKDQLPTIAETSLGNKFVRANARPISEPAHVLEILEMAW